MKAFDVALKKVSEGLRTIAQGMEKIAEKLEDSVPKGKVKAKSTRKVAAKPKKAPAKKGINSTTLAKKTGFDNKNIANLVFKLRKQGKVKSVARGVYTKARVAILTIT